MLRYGDSATKSHQSFAERESDYFDTDAINVDSSFQSTTSGMSGLNHSASSSKAVLAALRALQDKIRRLETERSSALDEAAQLRNQLKSQEIEAEHNKEKDIIHNQKSLQEARIAYERVLNEKDELENSLKTMRSQNDKVQDHIHELREKNKQLEEMKANAESRLKDMEEHLQKFEAEIDKAKSRENDLSNAMVWETKHHEEEMAALRSQIASLKEEHGTSSKERADKDAKLIELDHLVGQLLSVNETLICQISGKRISSIKGASTKLTSAKKKKKKVTVPKAATKSTASNDAKVAAGTAKKRSVSLDRTAASRSIIDTTPSRSELLGMHEMYVQLANSITGNSRNTSKLSSGNKAKKTMGKSSGDTQMRRRKLAKKREEEKLMTSSQDAVVGLEDFEKKYMTPSSSATFQSSHVVSALDSTSSSLNQSELQALINSLEEEFEGLNAQYQRILSLSNEKKSEESSQELVSVIQRLHKKGEQLRALKSPSK